MWLCLWLGLCLGLCLVLSLSLSLGLAGAWVCASLGLDLGQGMGLGLQLGLSLCIGLVLGLGLWLCLCLAACRSACLLACLPVYLLAQVLGLCHKMGDRRMHESMMNIAKFGSLAMRKTQDLLYVWFCWCLLHVTFSCFYCEIASKCKDSKKMNFHKFKKHGF